MKPNHPVLNKSALLTYMYLGNRYHLQAGCYTALQAGMRAAERDVQPELVVTEVAQVFS